METLRHGDRCDALSALLAERGVAILDGAQGTELERRGVSLGGSKLWSAQLLIDDPDMVRDIHLDYLRAGSDVITTFTYQASLQGFAQAGVDAPAAAALLNLAVDLADQARTQFMAEQETQQQQQQQQQQQGQQEQGQQEQGAQGAQQEQQQQQQQQQQQGQGVQQGQQEQGQREQGQQEQEQQEQEQAQQSGQLGQPEQGEGSAEQPTQAGQAEGPHRDAAGPAAASPSSSPSPSSSAPASTAPAASPQTLPSSRRHRPLVAYSCGSYGAFLADGSEFRGDYADAVPAEVLAAFHAARLEPVRGRPEVDLLAFETVPCAAEAEAIVGLLRRERYGKPAWISFSCKDGHHTCHGEDFAERCVPLLAAAAAEGLVVAAGVNCTAPRHVPALLAAARAKLRQLAAEAAEPKATAAVPVEAEASEAPGASASAAPHGEGQNDDGAHPRAAPGRPLGGGELLLLCYPNSGEDWDGTGRCWHNAPDDISEPGRFAEAVAGWVRGGDTAVALVGGCCRTGPAHIAELRRRLAP